MKKFFHHNTQESIRSGSVDSFNIMFKNTFLNKEMKGSVKNLIFEYF